MNLKWLGLGGKYTELQIFLYNNMHLKLEQLSSERLWRLYYFTIFFVLGLICSQILVYKS
jgi:hypothetical protein